LFKLATGGDGRILLQPERFDGVAAFDHIIVGHADDHMWLSVLKGTVIGEEAKVEYQLFEPMKKEANVGNRHHCR